MYPIHDDNPASLKPWVTIVCCAFMVWGFVWTLTLGDSGATRARYALGLVPAVLTGRAVLAPELAGMLPPLTLVSSLFLHADVLHLIGNLLYLWVFGNNIEDAMGHRRFLVFFVLCGVFAGLLQAAVAPASGVPVIGASGAISGVLGAYLLLHPRSSVLLLLPLGFVLLPLRLPAALLLGLWFVVQLAGSLLGDATSPGIAWHAHIGGFVVGALLVLFLKRRDVPLLAV